MSWRRRAGIGGLGLAVVAFAVGVSAGIAGASVTAPYSTGFEGASTGSFINYSTSGNPYSGPTMVSGVPSFGADDGTNSLELTGSGVALLPMTNSGATTYTVGVAVYIQSGQSWADTTTGTSFCPASNDVICAADTTGLDTSLVATGITVGSWQWVTDTFTAHSGATWVNVSLGSGSLLTGYDDFSVVVGSTIPAPSGGAGSSGGTGGSGGGTFVCSNCLTQSSGGGLLGSIGSGISSVVSGIGSVISGIGSLASSIVGPITSALSSLGSFIVNGLQSVFQFLFVPSASDTASFTGLWTLIKTKAPTSVVYDAVTFLPTLLGKVSSGMGSASTATPCSSHCTVADGFSVTNVWASVGTGSGFSSSLSVVRGTMLLLFMGILAFGLYRTVSRVIAE